MDDDAADEDDEEEGGSVKEKEARKWRDEVNRTGSFCVDEEDAAGWTV